ncbi:hypothetical protein [Rariglobus hedericola]|uniref:Uncharacterized protein n=1 Tax=Rariglobus hedericola TaxID=2597822 RepID=A0A556QDK1_9BACT|nr:hypothetical protein [Rariglobus hedericola]TSJ74725.1 hypothetical protein FPL22_17435 [Rariglobus hedericola]
MTTPAPATESNSAPAGIAAWRILLRMLAGFFAMFSFAFWAAAGWNLGWTKTQIPMKQIDEVTGIEFVTYKDHFMPGVELFGPALFLCLVLFAITFIRRKKPAGRS